MIIEIVGMKFRGALAMQAVRELNKGDPVWLKPEFDNPHDSNAIRVLLGESRTFVAYVGRGYAADLAPYMDPSKEYEAVVESVTEGPKGPLCFVKYPLE